MSHIELINKLKSEGWKIRVSHLRNSNQKAKSKRTMNLISLSDFLADPNRGTYPLGGKTIVSLRPPASNSEFVGESTCLWCDRFEYRYGRRAAFKNALAAAGIL